MQVDFSSDGSDLYYPGPSDVGKGPMDNLEAVGWVGLGADLTYLRYGPYNYKWRETFTSRHDYVYLRLGVEYNA